MSDNFTGNGLKNMKQRAINIGGTLEIKSVKGMGAEIRLHKNHMTMCFKLKYTVQKFAG